MISRRVDFKVITFFIIVIFVGLILSGCSSGGSSNEENIVETTSISGTVKIPAGNPVVQEVSFLENIFARAYAFEGDTPLTNAEIIIKDFVSLKVLKTAVTDNEGKYTITGLKKGIDVIIIVIKEFNDGSKVRLSGIIPDVGQQNEIDGNIDAATSIFTETTQYERETTNLTNIDKDFIKARVERVKEVVQKEMDNNNGEFNMVINAGIISESFGDGIKDDSLKQAVDESYQKPQITEIPDQNVNVGEEIKIQVSAVDLDGDSLSYSAAGDLSSNFDSESRTFSWTPTSSDVGTYNLTINVSDGSLSDSESFTIIVGDINQQPVASNDSASADEDGTVLIDVLVNDTDVDGDTLSISGFTQGTNGTAAQEGDSLRYTPDADYNGSDSFDYDISDGNGGTATGTVNVTINAINDAPVLSSVGNKSVNEGEILEFTVSASDVEGDSLIYSAAGDLSSNFDSGSRTFSWIPTSSDAGRSYNLTINVSDGSLSDSETITISVGDINQKPVANTDNETIDEDNSITLNVLSNDSDPDGDTLRLDSVNDDTSIGTVVYDFDGTVTYTSFPNYNGTDSFTYEISDRNGGTATGTVNLTINAVNDVPVLDPIGNQSTEENVELSFSIGFEDDDGDGIISTASGDLAEYFNSGTQTFTWTPGYSDAGEYTLTIEVSDGTATDSETITISVGNINRAPEATVDEVSVDEDGTVLIDVLANDIDIDGDDISIKGFTSFTANGTIAQEGDSLRYTPDADFNGTDSFTYDIGDGNGGTATGTVTVTVNPVNDAPTANDDNITVLWGQSITVNVLVNDIDVDGDTLSIVSYTQGSNGNVTQSGNSLIYDHIDGLNDSFTYTISDGTVNNITATVDVHATE